MSIPIELLREMGLSLTAEQQARLEEASRQYRQTPLASPTAGDDLGLHLDRILNASTGLNKWSTDPINRTSFLLAGTSAGPSGTGNNKKAAGRKWSFLSKSSDQLSNEIITAKKVDGAVPAVPKRNTTNQQQASGAAAKENKRNSQEASRSHAEGGLKKKARSVECLQERAVDLPELQSPPSQTAPFSPVSGHPRAPYNWQERSNQQRQSQQQTEEESGSSNSDGGSAVSMSPAQSPVLMRRPSMSRGRPAFHARTVKTFSPPATTPAPTAPQVPVKPGIIPSSIKSIDQPKLAEKSVPAAPKGYHLKDLLLELGIEEGTTECSDPGDNKYDSFKELSQSISPARLDEAELEEVERCELDSAIHTEPVCDRLVEDLLSDEYCSKPYSPSMPPAGKSCLFQDPFNLTNEEQHPQQQPVKNNSLMSRFMSKYGLEGGSSQMTIVQPSSCATLDSIDDEDEASGISKYPLLSPSYSTYLIQQQQQQHQQKVQVRRRNEQEPREEPETGQLLRGVQQEIQQQDTILYQNYRACLRHTQTALPLSFQELKARIEEYGLDIQFKAEPRTADLKELFLLPLNGTTVPRWIPASASFRVGRGSAWFAAPTRVVSRNHCEIFHDIHSYYVKDVGSKSGTFVNGSRLSPAESISMPRELKHGDILQVGVDFTAEADQFGQIPDRFRSGQCLALYGYRSRAGPAPKAELEEVKPAALAGSGKDKRPSSSLAISDSKFERMARKAQAQKSRLASAQTKLFIEFGDYISETAAGTAILLRTDNPDNNYSFAFNNYRLSWDISMTSRCTGKTIGLALEQDAGNGHQVYKIFAGNDKDQVRARVVVQGKQKLLLEPVVERDVLEEEQQRAAAIMALARKTSAAVNVGPKIQIPGASPYLIASPKGVMQQQQPSIASFTIPTINSIISSSEPAPQQDHRDEDLNNSTRPKHPVYTLTGDLQPKSSSSPSSLAFYVQRHQNCKKQIFLGEGQVSARKSQWGRKTIFYEARLPLAEQHDDLLAMMTMFNVLNQLEKI